ncbi:MAG: AAA family ATPase [Clostridiales bacterium]|nr:AAA family ATPase [Clostridiales bacterium]
MNDPLYVTGISFDRERFDISELSADNKYLKKIPVVENLNRISFKSQVTFFVGENGTGKSTLIEAIALCCGFNPEGGSRNFNFSTRSSHSALHEFLNVNRGRKRPRDGYFLRAESFYNVATNIEELDKIPAASPPISDGYGGRSLHEMSHGESFFALMNNRFFGNGLYILDEPEAALSPSRIMAMLSLINQLCNNNSQFIISTHSPILLSYPGADIYELHEDRISLTPYRETECYQVTRRFLENPERMLKYLME